MPELSLPGGEEAGVMGLGVRGGGGGGGWGAKLQADSVAKARGRNTSQCVWGSQHP